jgi:ankyrin repeat protein
VAERDDPRTRPAIVEAARRGDTAYLSDCLSRSPKENPLAESSSQPISRIDVNVLGSSGMTGAMWAARNGHVDALKVLIDAGAEVVTTKVEVSL